MIFGARTGYAGTWYLLFVIVLGYSLGTITPFVSRADNPQVEPPQVNPPSPSEKSFIEILSKHGKVKKNARFVNSDKLAEQFRENQQRERQIREQRKITIFTLGLLVVGSVFIIFTNESMLELGVTFLVFPSRIEKYKHDSAIKKLYNSHSARTLGLLLILRYGWVPLICVIAFTYVVWQAVS